MCERPSWPYAVRSIRAGAAGYLAKHSLADELCLSVKTISAYRSRILDKMSLENNAQLIRVTPSRTSSFDVQ